MSARCVVVVVRLTTTANPVRMRRADRRLGGANSVRCAQAVRSLRDADMRSAATRLLIVERRRAASTTVGFRAAALVPLSSRWAGTEMTRSMFKASAPLRL